MGGGKETPEFAGVCLLDELAVVQEPLKRRHVTFDFFTRTDNVSFISEQQLRELPGFQLASTNKALTPDCHAYISVHAAAPADTCDFMRQFWSMGFLLAGACGSFSLAVWSRALRGLKLLEQTRPGKCFRQP